MGMVKKKKIFHLKKFKGKKSYLQPTIFIATGLVTIPLLLQTNLKPIQSWFNQINQTHPCLSGHVICVKELFLETMYIQVGRKQKKNNLMSLDLKKRRDSMNHRHKIDVNLTSLSFHIKTQHIQQNSSYLLHSVYKKKKLYYT